MAFQVPRNVPSFNDPQRRFEDTVWRSRASIDPQKGLGAVFGGQKNGLPMYKDKPYNYSGSERNRRFLRRKRVLAGALVLLCGFAWWFGILGWFWGGSAKEEQGTEGWFQKMKGGEKKGAKVNWLERRDRVRDAFKVSWAAYEKHGWGYDEFHPSAKTGRHMTPKGLGWIIVDALDTLMIMNLTSELAHARDWVTNTLDYDQDHDVNTFETTIRMLGGLLSAHYLTKTFPDMAPLPPVKGSDDLYLEKASDLADKLLSAYESPSGIPYASVNLHQMKGIVSHADGGASSTAEATTLQLEMKYLAKLTGEELYWQKAENVMKIVDDNGAQDGLVPIFIYADGPSAGHFRDNNIRLGSRGDSYYEYLIKQYLQTNKQEPVYLDMWEQALGGVRKHLITYSSPSNLTVLAERPQGITGDISPKMDHLVCFMPGTIALGVTGGSTVAEAKKAKTWGKKQEADMKLAEELMKTCYGMYKVTATGLAPEITYFHVDKPPKMASFYPEGTLQSPEIKGDAGDEPWRQDFDIHPADTHNLQRPETVESLFYMWRITKDEKYRRWGWEIFESFVKYEMLEDGAGFSSIGDVTKIPPPSRDNMESFWLAETLKYLYLLFGPDDILPLDQVVYNTEAHPLPRFDLGKLFKTGWSRRPRDEEGNLLPDKKEQKRDEEKNDEVKIQTVLVSESAKGS